MEAQIDRAKVIDALEDIVFAWYFEEPVPVKDYDMLPVAIDLLSEREPKEEWDFGHYYACGACGATLGILHGDPLFCPHCGRKVKWREQS